MKDDPQPQPLDRWKRFLVATHMWSLDYAQQLQAKPNDPASRHSAKLIVRELAFHTLLVVACGWMLLGLWWDIDEPGDNWFQRSGAVLVATALLSEYFSTPSHAAMTNDDGHGRVQSFFRVFGFVATAIGTIVWAYGDMPFPTSCPCE